VGSTIRSEEERRTTTATTKTTQQYQEDKGEHAASCSIRQTTSDTQKKTLPIGVEDTCLQEPSTAETLLLGAVLGTAGRGKRPHRQSRRHGINASESDVVAPPASDSEVEASSVESHHIVLRTSTLSLPRASHSARSAALRLPSAPR